MKHATPGCVLWMLTEGFEEIEVITLLSLLRKAGVCAKSVGLTSGLVGGAYGIRLMPDLTLSDLDPLTKAKPIDVVVLPEGGPGLSQLETDPRLQRWLGQVAAQGGKIAIGPQTKRILDAIGAGLGPERRLPEPALLLREANQSAEHFAHQLIQLRKEHEVHS